MTKHEEQWDIHIDSRPGLLNFNIKEVWRYKDLVWLFVRRDFVAQYKQTILGPFWHLIQPLLTTMIFVFIFSRVAKIPSNGIPPVLFYISGLTLWNYFSGCLTSISSTFLSNANIFGKVYFPRLVVPLSIMISNIIRFGIQFLLVVAAMIWYHFDGFTITISLYIFILPFLILLLATLSLGIGMIVSSLTTKYRDFSLLLTFAVQLYMYATPIVYPLSFLENTKYAFFISLNPLTAIVEGFRFALFQSGTFDLATLWYPTIFAIIAMLVGTLYFNKVEKNFMDTI